MTIEGMSATEMVDVLIKFQITPKQFILLWILELDRREGLGQISSSGKSSIQNVYRIAEQLQAWTEMELDDLVEKGLLIDHNPKSGERQAYPDNYEVSNIFMESIMSTMSDFEEFWQLYPGFVDNFQDPQNGRRILADSKLKKLLKLTDTDELTYFNLQRYMSPHFAKAGKALAASA